MLKSIIPRERCSPVNIWSRVSFWILATMACLPFPRAWGQFNYLSDSDVRYVSGHAFVDTNSFYPPYHTIDSYSGNYSGEAAPSAELADFSANLTGTATVFFGGGNPSSSISSSLSVAQSSFLHPEELSYSSSLTCSWGSLISQPPPGVFSQGLSILKVSFTVPEPVQFNLMAKGYGDPLSISDLVNLSGSISGSLFDSVYVSNGVSVFGLPINYSGTFYPDQIYTLSLSSDGSRDSSPGLVGGLDFDLVASTNVSAVPEPSVLTMTGLIAVVMIFLKISSLRRKQVSPAKSNQACRRDESSRAGFSTGFNCR